MGGAFKSGLLFGVIGVLIVAGLTYVFPLCGPVGAVIIGSVAGYFGVRWSAPSAGVGSGVLAGSIAGGLMLIGSIVIMILTFNRISSDPEFQQVFQQALQQQQQQQETKLTAEQQQFVLNAVGPFLGFCFGLINLVVALIFGALGGLIGARNRTPNTQPPMPPTPPTPPTSPKPMDPPPLSPL